MGCVIKYTKRWKPFERIFHLLFQCPTFWYSFVNPKARRCPVCNRKIRCYWLGHDVNHMNDVCNRCFPKQEGIEKYEKAYANIDS